MRTRCRDYHRGGAHTNVTPLRSIEAAPRRKGRTDERAECTDLGLPILRGDSGPLPEAEEEVPSLREGSPARDACCSADAPELVQDQLSLV